MEEFLFFTPEQKAEIRKILRAYSSEFIDRFINGVDSYCYEFLRLKTPPVEQVRRKLSDRQATVLADVRQTITHLKTFATGNEEGAVPDCLDGVFFVGDGHTLGGNLKTQKIVNFILSGAAKKALPALLEFEYQLEGAVILNKGTHGRPHPFSAELVEKMAWFFDSYLGNPTSYRDGVFYEIVQFILAELRLSSKDPTRQIRAALKKHREKHPYRPRFCEIDQRPIIEVSPGVYTLGKIGDENPRK
jgi:hypothetical protein